MKINNDLIIPQSFQNKPYYEASNEIIRILYPGTSYIEIKKSGKFIDYMPLEDFSKNIDLFKSRIVNHVLPYSLFQDKQTIFHASCISDDDGAILFIGRSGAGKSSLAASLEGYSFISEDSAYVKLIDDKYHVIRSSNFVKLSPDIAKKLNFCLKEGIKLKGDRLKRSLYNTKKSEHENIKIKKCYFLNWGDSFSINKMNKKDAIAVLLACSFSSFPINSCKISAKIFNNFIFNFVNNIDVFNLTRDKKNFFSDNQYIAEHLKL